ncbi:hypothetical protein V493_02713 [Pseudogymnoascus sp. VKM F-4281 (FW-2241)]|nr:hypothetical protein V493_02713 [Pseudogymnoascus sp. VKM F-4281 (FW-2241)]
MEGVISTASWVDGRFMEREVDIETILSGNSTQEKIKLEVKRPPKIGLLTQTVIDSPISNWILPARLGNVDDHDVVFIGDNLLQVKRLVKSGRLSEVGRVANLGSRIRNARVLGSVDWKSPAPKKDGSIRERSVRPIPGAFNEYSEPEGESPKGCLHGELHVDPGSHGESDSSMSFDDSFLNADDSSDLSMFEPSNQENYRLGPQIIVFVLEAGDLMFFCAPDFGPDELIQPILIRHNIAKPLLGENLGAHLAADPSSRYLALGCSENVISIYSLKSREEMDAQYISGQPLSCIREERSLQVKGVILKIEFLFPSFQDPDHIILLLLISRNGKTRMHVYEWISGQPLSAIRQNHKKGHLLDERYRTPILLIPLTIKSAFILVCEQGVAVCEGLLEGSPQCHQSHLGHDEPSPIHKGRNAPLWTSWTRPVRTQKFAATNDDIYIAREDGLVKYLENNRDEFLCTGVNLGGITCNIGTAFTSLDSKFPGPNGVIGDILLVGGDSCPGGVYWVQARQPARLLATLQNWTPLNDFVTIPTRQPLLSLEQHPHPNKHQTPSNSEQIFGCTGRGPYGTISEINRGIGAEIWMELDELGSVITGIWALPIPPITNSQHNDLSSSSLLLLSAGNESLLLMLENHGGGITGVTEIDSTWLDLTSRTLDASSARGFVTQITERYIRISNKPANFSTTAYSKAFKSDEFVIAASIYQNELVCIAFQTEKGEFRIDLFRFTAYEPLQTQTDLSNKPPLIKIGSSIFIDLYPTFLSFVDPADKMVSLVIGHGPTDANGDLSGLSRNSNSNNDISTLRVYQFDSSLGIIQDGRCEFLLSNSHERSHGPMGSCVSVLMLSRSENGLDSASPTDQYGLLLAGHGNGVLFMAYYATSPDNKIQQRVTTSRQLGATNLNICKDPAYPAAALICCGSDLYRIVYSGDSNLFPPITRIVFKNAGISIYPQPSIDLVCRLDEGFLAISGKQILGIEIENEITGISSSIELPGSAQRMIYCHTTESLVVAAAVEGRPAIVFVATEAAATEVISLKHMQSSRHTDRILSLTQWWLNTSSDSSVKEEFIVAGTSSGAIFILRQDCHLKTSTSKSKATGFRIFIEQRFSHPIHAAVQGGANGEILFCCIGGSLHSMALNINEETLVSLAEYQLPSHAVSMNWESKYLSVLTAKDSIMTLLYKDNGKYQLQYVDEGSRTGLDHMSFPLEDVTPPEAGSTLLLVSDKDCSVVGLHYQRKTSTGQTVPREYATLFEAEMPSCTTKFRLATTHHNWDTSQNELSLSGVIPWGDHREDLLGISIDGSVRRFTLVDESLLKLLGILEHIARHDARICPTYFQEGEEGDVVLPSDQDDARKRHIDADILRGWLEFRHLEEFLTKTMSAKQELAKTWIEALVSAVALHWPEKCLGLHDNERLRTSVEIVYHLLEQLVGAVDLVE